MRHSLISLAAIVILPWAGAMAQEPLPDDVAQLYVAYQQAEQSGDLEAALEAAEAVFEAGQTARIDEATLGTLSENVGFYARTTGDFERAYEAWRFAAEKSEDDDLMSGYRWQNAAVAAYRLGDHRDAFRCSRNASNAYARAGALPAGASEYAIQAHVLAARLAGDNGRRRQAGEAAERALALIEGEERAIDRATAMAYFYAGLNELAGNNFLPAAVKLRLARDVFIQIDAAEAEQETARVLSGYARRRALREISDNSENRRYQAAAEQFDAEMAGLLTAYPFHLPPPEEDEEEFRPRDGAIDAQALSRRPPRYPRYASQNGYEGFLAVRFDVDERGRTINHRVIFSIPNGVFDEAAIDAISNWTYEPATLDGEPVVRQGVETQFNFELAN